MRTEIDGIKVFQSIAVGDYPVQRPCADEEFLYIPFIVHTKGSLKDEAYYMAIPKAIINGPIVEVVDDGTGKGD